MGLRGLLTILAVAFAATACASSDNPEPANVACTAESAPPPGSAPGQTPVLFTLVTTPNGWQRRANLQPELIVYADGHAVSTPNAVGPSGAPDPPPPSLPGYIPKCLIDDAIADTVALRGVDFGSPTITDQGSRSIDYTHDPAVHLSIYAPGATNGLTQAQIDARARFAALYGKLIGGFVEAGSGAPK
ncbi:hypothetical protein [Antrihabitans cavernicola]|uniref:DUF3558 domain-containing protein n=1 Tax=Antrihabitans cavernicola TaxID=2495913 RepID=A0A5A7SCI9_9NOCA|nr:hypothetical protein [Spelaeibacter cavernicola]KAA0021911.1 hypothetical protein FOY51_16080 [Spelaeibacter cavernicola]